MAPNPRRDTPAGRAYNDLRNKARREGRPTDELLTLFVLERFLYRLSRSDVSDRFALKGGMLLSAYHARRTTRDADLSGIGISVTGDDAVAVMARVADMAVDDGVEFLVGQIRSRAIREDGPYGGTRVVIPAQVARFRTSVQIDVSSGDPIVPGVQRIDFPQQLQDSSFELLAYPIETVLAEKVLTALERGDANTRVRDYADVWRLIAGNAFAGAGLFEAVAKAADHRGLKPGPLSERITSLVELRGRVYREWRRRLGPDGDAYPEDFGEVVAAVIAFADPLLLGEVVGVDWDPDARSWRR
ncbi:nucleotidyl transferase AbiEii/AbiGii toxin family protein [Actinoallomurus liliacearum]|uniref:Nucleotidyl transferase AbiEii/AbiGii toxin family protein n=1 Tax=Actinoallomurus liliacearum TaxID=1080073 RepID=A0ABP8TQX7_9ACTN